jgi:HAD superfamily hydrolase (TIGR01490 family)
MEYNVGMADKKPVAVFDVDGSIFRSSLFVELVEMMIQDGILPTSVREEYEAAHNNWLDRKGGYAEYMDAMLAAFYANIKGVHYGDFVDISKKVIAKQGKHTYKYSRDLIRELKEKGYFLLAVSHSPKTILDLFCNEYGFDKAYGMVYEIGPEDMLTGEVADRHLILNKANIVRRAVEKENLTLEGSVGIGDTESDLSFLELVTTPICFNPNATLYRHAKLQGWKVVVERKDVVYEL